MPTGYTAAIADGISFQQFAMNCSRALGALVEMRDAPQDAAIPESFKASQWNAQQLAVTLARLDALRAMSPEQAERAAGEAWDKEETARQQRRHEREALKIKYEAMLCQVEAWTPPTADHDGLRNFMREQIQQSIDFDCNWRFDAEPKPRVSGAEWLAQEIDAAERAIKYHTTHQAQEDERAARNTAWVAALRESLGDRFSTKEPQQ